VALGMEAGTSKSPVLNVSDVAAALVHYHSTGLIFEISPHVMIYRSHSLIIQPQYVMIYRSHSLIVQPQYVMIYRSH
jgi:hypothetical protein